MSVLECPHCTRQFRALPDVVGRTIRCRGCRQMFRVPAGEAGRPAALAAAAEGVFAGTVVRSCPMCGHTFPMQQRLAGKAIRCRRCRSTFRVLHEAERLPPAEGAMVPEAVRPAGGQPPPGLEVVKAPEPPVAIDDDAGDVVDEREASAAGLDDVPMRTAEAVVPSSHRSMGGGRDGTFGMLIAVLVGGLLAFPVSQIVCWWGMDWDPFGVAPKLRPELRWLAPSHLVAGSPDRE